MEGTRGLFGVALFWNGIMGLITLCMAGSLLGGNQMKPGDDAVWAVPLILAFFWAVGIGLLLGALNMGQRRAASLAVTGGSLMVLQTGLFGGKRRTWEPGDVAAVRVGPSGLEVNEVPVQELQIIDAAGQSFTVLAGRTDDELEWVAEELRRALNVGIQLR